LSTTFSISLVEKKSVPRTEPLKVHFAEPKRGILDPGWRFQTPTRKQRLIQHYTKVPVRVLGKITKEQERLEAILAPIVSTSHVNSFEEFVEFLGLTLYAEAKRKERDNSDKRIWSPFQEEEQSITASLPAHDIRNEIVSSPEETPKVKLREISDKDGKQALTPRSAPENFDCDSTKDLDDAGITVPGVELEVKKARHGVARIWESIVQRSGRSRVS
jgi:hypothetical protein